MHIDLDLAAEQTEHHSQVCILGAGIAGLLIAKRLAGRGLHVHLLEAGGFDLEDRSQQLYSANMAAETHAGTTEGRFRIFGGSSTRWGGQLLPYTADIFAPPAGSPSLPWPVHEEDLTPYYAEIQRIFGVDDLPFTSDLLPALEHPCIDLSDDIRLRFSKWAPFSKRNLAQTIGRECLAHPRITVFTHANTLSLAASEAGSAIVSARVVNYAGRSFRFTADRFIVCMGTIESSRLLLCSGPALNPHDQLGRYFHDHLGVQVAAIDGAARTQMLDRLGPFFVDGTLHTCKLEASTALRARENLLAVMAHVTISEPEDSGAAAIRNLLRSLQHGRLREAIAENLLPVLRGLPDVARLAWSSRVHKRRAVSSRATVHLNIDLEQAPHAENRIRLDEERDVLGMQKVTMQWRVGDAERAAVHHYARTVKTHLETAGFAPFHWAQGVLDGTALPPLQDTYHQMGGLRMGTDSRESVVDTNLRVHGIANLHVASCAVFPSGGSSNPTFTMMALALRLADHLAKDSLATAKAPPA